MLSYFQKFTASVSRWLGKGVDYDRAYGSQCVDFARQYCQDVGSPIGTFSGSAYNGWITGSPFDRTWRRVAYSAGKVPNPGDVVFFAPWPGNKYGHVAIADTGCTGKALNVIEQNAGRGSGTGTGSDAVRKHAYDYANPKCVGWFTNQS